MTPGGGRKSTWAILWEPPRLTRELVRGLEGQILFGSDVPTTKVRVEDGLQKVRDLHLDADAARPYGAA